jgi:hypothetical protein
MLTEAYGADVMKKSSIFEWHKRLKEGWEDVKDDKRTGHLKTHQTDENVEKVCFEGPQIFRHCRHSGTCDDHPAEHSRRGVPEMFWEVQTSTHYVYWCTRRLRRMWQNPSVCK